MSFSCVDIENVRASALPDAIATDGGDVGLSRTALVTWRSSLEQSVFQVYVNGKPAGVTLDSQQRKLVVEVPSSFESAAHIEVIAVEPRDAHADFSGEIDQAAISCARVKLSLLRTQDLPPGATANFYLDDGPCLNASPVPIWPCWHDKAGFGLAQFGLGDFGYDSAAAVGFGKGSFGHGHFGLDADTLQWTSPALPPGQCQLGVEVIDAYGNESLISETDTIAIVPGARPASELDVVAFDETTGQLTLSLSD